MKRLIAFVLALLITIPAGAVIKTTASDLSEAVVISKTGKETFYDSIASAVLALSDGDTLKLTRDVSVTETVKIGVAGGSVTVDGDGHTLSADPGANGYALAVKAPESGIYIRGLRIASSAGGLLLDPGAAHGESVSIEDCTVLAGGASETSPGQAAGDGVRIASEKTCVRFVGDGNFVRTYSGNAVNDYGSAVIEGGYFITDAGDTTLYAQTGGDYETCDRKLIVTGGVVVNRRFCAARATGGASIYVTGGDFIVDCPSSSGQTVRAGTDGKCGYAHIFGGNFYSNTSSTLLGKAGNGKLYLYGGNFFSANDPSANFSDDFVDVGSYDKVNTVSDGNGNFIFPDGKYVSESAFGYAYSVTPDEASAKDAVFAVSGPDGAVLNYTDGLGTAELMVPSGGSVSVLKDYAPAAATENLAVYYPGHVWTLDGNGHVCAANIANRAVYAFRSGTVTVKDFTLENPAGKGITVGVNNSRGASAGVYFENASVTSGAECIEIFAGSEAAVHGGIYESAGTCAVNVAGGTLTVTGGEFYSPGSCGAVITGETSDSRIAVSGGRFVNTGNAGAAIYSKPGEVFGFPNGKTDYSFPTTPRYAGCQENVYGDTYDVRFLAVIGTRNAEEAGFTVKAVYSENGETKVKEYEKPVSCLYHSVNAAGNMEEYTARELGGEYIFAVTLKGVPKNVGKIEFTVIPYCIDGGSVTHSGGGYRAVYDSGVFVSTGR